MLISAGGIMLGTAALVVTLAILSGFEQTLTNNVLGFTSNVEISSYGNRPLPDYLGIARFLKRKVPEITQITPFVEHDAILRSPRGVSGVVLRGVPPEDTTVLAMNRILSGQPLAPHATDSIDPIVISKGLAQQLRTTVGKNIAAIRFNEQLRTREDILANLHIFRVVGTYATGMSQYDDMLAYTTLHAAQSFNGYSPTQVSGYDVRTATLAASIPVAAKLNRVLFYPYLARSVYDVYPTIFAWIDLQKKPIPIILGLIILVAAFNIVSTLLLIVIEKTRSIGVLKSLGASTGKIARIFITQGMTIAIFGTLMGDALGFTLCTLEDHFHFFKLRSDIYFMTSVPVSIEWQHYAIVSAIALVLALSATLIPARIAARMQPLHALSFA
ncbi:MAG TPA: ABC transporter permease [Candidatus Kapabacteria bacterium]|nr:ABC transporter permease [Candidatus Kapabacteria bacterium]